MKLNQKVNDMLIEIFGKNVDTDLSLEAIADISKSILGTENMSPTAVLLLLKGRIEDERMSIKDYASFLMSLLNSNGYFVDMSDILSLKGARKIEDIVKCVIARNIAGSPDNESLILSSSRPVPDLVNENDKVPPSNNAVLDIRGHKNIPSINEAISNSSRWRDDQNKICFPMLT